MKAWKKKKVGKNQNKLILLDEIIEINYTYWDGSN